MPFSVDIWVVVNQSQMVSWTKTYSVSGRTITLGFLDEIQSKEIPSSLSRWSTNVNPFNSSFALNEPSDMILLLLFNFSPSFSSIFFSTWSKVELGTTRQLISKFALFFFLLRLSWNYFSSSSYSFEYNLIVIYRKVDHRILNSCRGRSVEQEKKVVNEKLTTERLKQFNTSVSWKTTWPQIDVRQNVRGDRVRLKVEYRIE